MAYPVERTGLLLGGGRSKVGGVLSRWGVASMCAGAVILGVGVVLWGVTTLRDGKTVVGLAVTVCGVLGAAFGAAGLVLLARRRP